MQGRRVRRNAAGSDRGPTYHSPERSGGWRSSRVTAGLLPGQLVEQVGGVAVAVCSELAQYGEVVAFRGELHEFIGRVLATGGGESLQFGCVAALGRELHKSSAASESPAAASRRSSDISPFSAAASTSCDLASASPAAARLRRSVSSSSVMAATVARAP